MQATKLAVIVFAVLLGSSALSSAYAETPFAAQHPRRDQVNDRLQTQHRRIHQEVKEGEMSHAKAMRLHRADHRVRMNERRFAARHHGAISRAEQTRLNRQENRISRHIGK